MSDAATLLDAIKAGDDNRALEILRAHPEAASGRGPAGESPILIARYYGKAALATEMAALAKLELPEAAALGDAAQVQALLDAGASTDVMSFDGWTPLHLTAFFGHADAARVLLDRGADLEAISRNSTANTPLCAALAGQADLAFVQLLVSRGANVNARVELGITPLHLAASRGVIPVLQLLLDAGANRAAAMNDGVTPAAMALARGHEAAATLLATAVSR